MGNIDFLSLVTAPVRVYAATEALVCTATAFFYKRDQNWIYIVTNWHIVTGRDTQEPKYSKTGAIPTKIELKLHRNVGEKMISMSQKESFLLDLNDENGCSARWLEHPKWRHNVDIAIIRIKNEDNFFEKFTCYFLDEYQNFERRYDPSVMDDVFVIGYPWGLAGGDGVLPLYKRGSVSSDPVVGHKNLPRFLIDCNTTSGMSGSPVICARSGPWHPSGTLSLDSVMGTVKNFAGVYSGRLEGTEGNTKKDSDIIVSDIGIVWGKELIEEIIAEGVQGASLSEISSY